MNGNPFGSSDQRGRDITDLRRRLRQLEVEVEALTAGAATSASDVAFIPAGSIAATNVQAALAEVDSEKAPLSHTHNASDINAGTLGIARIPVAASGVSSATQVVRADDSRLSDARAPTAHTHTASQVTDFAEAVDDRVASLLVAGTNVSLTYNDAGNTLTISASASGSPYTSDLFTMDATGATTTVVSNGAITATSKIIFIPTNANAFSVDGAVASYAVAAGSMTVTHAASTLSRTFAYLVIP
jgi:hypothetical protein